MIRSSFPPTRLELQSCLAQAVAVRNFLARFRVILASFFWRLLEKWRSGVIASSLEFTLSLTEGPS